MKNVFRSLLYLFLSLLFHFLIFLFADVSMLPARSAPHEHTRIIAEVVLFPAPAKHAENPEGQNYNSENADRVQIRDEIKTEPIKAQEAVKPVELQKAPEAVRAVEPLIIPESVKPVEPQKAPEVTKPIEPQKPPEVERTAEPQRVPVAEKPAEPQRAPVRTQARPRAEPAQNTAVNTAQDKPEINADQNKTGLSGPRESAVSSSTQEEISSGTGNIAMGHLQPQSVPSIAAVDSVIVVNRVTPVYPQISRRRGEEGNAVLLANVENGRVVKVTIEKSSGIKALDSSALSAVGKWSFSSDTNITVRIPVSFKLKD
jgi:TonB family protein